MFTDKRNKKTIFVALSGGVDSSVAALLLKSKGQEVIGVHIKCWSEFDASGNCSAAHDEQEARLAAEHLGIPFYVWDFEYEYRAHVYQYFLREYASGRTPNPDVMCNLEIKFGLFLKRALKLGADYIATGHYVRKSEIINPKSETVRYKLLKAIDRNKDQSYFLWTLSQDILKHCLFPVGHLLKSQARSIASVAKLPNATRKDSQGLCFVGKIKLADFLKDEIPLEVGSIVSASGVRLGEHKGLAAYTIGQRQGLGVGGGGPFYVVEKDLKTNTLVVASPSEEHNFWRKEVSSSIFNWIGNCPSLPLTVAVKSRYRQSDVQATIDWQDNMLHVIFKEPQRALTPGQSMVFYQGEEVLGGAIIDDIK